MIKLDFKNEKNPSCIAIHSLYLKIQVVIICINCTNITFNLLSELTIPPGHCNWCLGMNILSRNYCPPWRTAVPPGPPPPPPLFHVCQPNQTLSLRILERNVLLRPTRTNRRGNNLVQGARDSKSTYETVRLGRGRVYAENEMVYGKVYKQKWQKYTVIASACALTELQWRPGRLFPQTLIDGLGRG